MLFWLRYPGKFWDVHVWAEVKGQCGYLSEGISGQKYLGKNRTLSWIFLNLSEQKWSLKNNLAPLTLGHDWFRKVGWQESNPFSVYDKMCAVENWPLGHLLVSSNFLVVFSAHGEDKSSRTWDEIFYSDKFSLFLGLIMCKVEIPIVIFIIRPDWALRLCYFFPEERWLI